MTKFTKDNLKFIDGCIKFIDENGKQHFVAALYKHGHDADKGPMMTFIRKNFTAEEWFRAAAAGFAPATICEARGFVTVHPRREAKRRGYPATPIGVKRMMADIYDYSDEMYYNSIEAMNAKAHEVEMAMANPPLTEADHARAAAALKVLEAA